MRRLVAVLTGSIVASIVVAAPAMATPIADFAFSPAEPRAGESLSLIADGSYCDARPCTYYWGEVAADGTETFLGSGRSRVVRLAIPGASSVTLTVTNRGFRAPPGPTSASVTKVINVGEPFDTSGPETTITSGPDESSSVAEATFVFSSEEGATFECRLDDAPWAACASPVTLAGLADGSHAFAVRATDALGNVELAENVHAWTVDTAPVVEEPGPVDPVPPVDPEPPVGGGDPLAGLDCQFGWVTFCVEPSAESV